MNPINRGRTPTAADAASAVKTFGNALLRELLGPESMVSLNPDSSRIMDGSAFDSFA
jgi:hypothetical protein